MHFPYVFPVKAWQYTGRILFLGLLNCGAKTHLDGDTLVVNTDHATFVLSAGDWIVEFPPGDLAHFPNDSFQGLFSQPARTPPNAQFMEFVATPGAA